MLSLSLLRMPTLLVSSGSPFFVQVTTGLGFPYKNIIGLNSCKSSHIHIDSCTNMKHTIFETQSMQMNRKQIAASLQTTNVRPHYLHITTLLPLTRKGMTRLICSPTFLTNLVLRARGRRTLGRSGTKCQYSLHMNECTMVIY